MQLTSIIPLLLSFTGTTARPSANWDPDAPQWPYWSQVEVFTTDDCCGSSAGNVTLSSEQFAEGYFCITLDEMYSLTDIRSVNVTSSNLAPENTTVTLCSEGCETKLGEVRLGSGCRGAPVEAFMFMWYTDVQ